MTSLTTTQSSHCPSAYLLNGLDKFVTGPLGNVYEMKQDNDATKIHCCIVKDVSTKIINNTIYLLLCRQRLPTVTQFPFFVLK